MSKINNSIFYVYISDILVTNISLMSKIKVQYTMNTRKFNITLMLRKKYRTYLTVHTTKSTYFLLLFSLVGFYFIKLAFYKCIIVT